MHLIPIPCCLHGVHRRLRRETAGVTGGGLRGADEKGEGAGGDHVQLREQLDVLLRERDGGVIGEEKDGGGGDEGGWLLGKGGCLSVFQSMGHAVHVCRPDSGKIIYWYGYCSVFSSSFFCMI